MPALRNPYNEIECSDHYSRAMASYGVFQAACGFNCHGPSGHIEFEPRLTPENFKAPFITAEGWGTYTQKIDGKKMMVTIVPKWGILKLKSCNLALAADLANKKIKRATLNGKPAKDFTQDGKKLIINFSKTTIDTGKTFTIELFA